MQDYIALAGTEDGSPTLYNAHFGEHYHSRHGALQESQHIFIQAGLLHRLSGLDEPELRVLELGFGTGLNALLTLKESLGKKLKIHYTSLELYPLPPEIYKQLDYGQAWQAARQYLLHLHQAPWGEALPISGAEHFVLHKVETDFLSFEAEGGYDLIYFDAFSPEVQPELWTLDLFMRLYQQARVGAVLTTYCAKGEVRRCLQAAGWLVERLPGPPGKREILRAIKA